MNKLVILSCGPVGKFLHHVVRINNESNPNAMISGLWFCGDPVTIFGTYAEAEQYVKDNS